MTSQSLRTSGFVDDVTVSHYAWNRPESKTIRMFRSVRQVAAPAAKSAVSDCILSAGCCGSDVVRIPANITVTACPSWYPDPARRLCIGLMTYNCPRPGTHLPVAYTEPGQMSCTLSCHRSQKWPV